MRDYGYMLEFREPALKAFEVTAQTCVASFTATRDDGSVPGPEVTFRTADGIHPPDFSPTAICDTTEGTAFGLSRNREWA